jgi:hypothetical protein
MAELRASIRTVLRESTLPWVDSTRAVGYGDSTELDVRGIAAFNQICVNSALLLKISFWQVALVLPIGGAVSIEVETGGGSSHLRTRRPFILSAWDN